MQGAHQALSVVVFFFFFSLLKDRVFGDVIHGLKLARDERLGG